MYYFSENKYLGPSSNINNGNIYTKDYLNRIEFPGTSTGEDDEITFHRNGKVYESKLKHTMIYRWGMNTLHVSGMGQVTPDVVNAQADKVLDNTTGQIILKPHFKTTYWEDIKE